MIEIIHDVSNGTITERELTAAEVKLVTTRKTEEDKKETELQEAAATKAAAKAALLSRLDMTEDEAKLLLS